MNETSKLSKSKLNKTRKIYQKLIRSTSSELARMNSRDNYFQARREHHSICKKLEKQYWYHQKENYTKFKIK